MALMIGSSGGGSSGVCIPRSFSTFCTFTKSWSGSGIPAPEDLETVLDVTGPGRLLCVYTGTPNNDANVIIDYDDNKLVILNCRYSAFESNLCSTKTAQSRWGMIRPYNGDSYAPLLYNVDYAYIPAGKNDVLDVLAEENRFNNQHSARFYLPEGLCFEQYLKVHAAYTGSRSWNFVITYEMFEPL